MTEPEFLDVDDVLALHEALLQDKRAAIGAALVFLDINGVNVPEATAALYMAMIDLAARRLDKPGLAVLLRRPLDASDRSAVTDSAAVVRFSAGSGTP